MSQLVEVDFPRFRDGRGYSSARILREAGYTGEIRAAGDVLVDQMLFMRRCGFDSFAPNAPVDAEVLEAALARYDYRLPARCRRRRARVEAAPWLRPPPARSIAST